MGSIWAGRVEVARPLRCGESISGEVSPEGRIGKNGER